MYSREGLVEFKFEVLKNCFANLETSTTRVSHVLPFLSIKTKFMNI